MGVCQTGKCRNICCWKQWMLWYRSHTWCYHFLLDGSVQEMKWLIIFTVSFYRRFVPEHLRRPCLFKETCSQHVLRVTREKGSGAGLKVLWLRFRRCRSGYHIGVAKDGAGLEVHLADGSTIPESEASPILISPHYEGAKKLENLINAKDSPYTLR